MDINEEIRRVIAEADCLYDREQIGTAIARLAREIGAALADSHPVVLTVLNGGIFFAGELLLQLDFPLELDSIKAGRYQGETRGSAMRWTLTPALPLSGRTVLVIDDILDEGLTLAEIVRYCEAAGAGRVLTAVLVDKLIGRDKPCRPDFVGLTAENRYLFGYGLDYKNHLRNWPGIYACRTVY
ncbi:hypoxanthine-guanine phosphoribosyltransferase [Methyloparacoccus murrellii]|jgi:hypoxanthine phosphoribosyltransferase